MRANRCTRRHFLTACGLAPFALAGCGKSSDKAEPSAKGLDERRVAQDLKRIGRAMHEYHAALRALPPGVDTAAIQPPAGGSLPPRNTPWRVALLPYLGHEELARAIASLKYGGEYWTSADLLRQCPEVYTADDSGNEATRTRYQVFVGSHTCFPPGKKVTLLDLTDGMSNTIMVVETEEAVPWTSPDDLAYDPKKPLPKLGHPERDGFYALMGDGSGVLYFPKTAAEQPLRALITRHGGEVTHPIPGMRVVR